MQITLVVAFAAVLIYFIGKQVLGAIRHPSEDEMIDFWNGHLKAGNRKRHRQISEHLATCEACRDRLDRIRKEYAGPGADAPLIERKY